MRIVSWNLNRATWSFHRGFSTRDEHRHGVWTQVGALDPDVALLQEAPPPPDSLARPPVATLPEGQDPEAWRSLPGPRRWWCSAIASWGPTLDDLETRLEYAPLDITHKGAYRVGLLQWRGAPLVVVSLYALWDYAGLSARSKPRYAETSLHRSLSDLTPVLDQHQPHPYPVVLAGDFNASTQFADPYRVAYRIVHERIKGLGLLNVTERDDGTKLEGCPCADEPCRHIRTLEGLVPYQDDYLYASPEVASAMRLVAVERTSEIEAVSDHFPLVAQLDD